MRLLSTIVLSVIGIALVAQTNVKDSLWRAFYTAKSDTAQIRHLAQLGKFYYTRDLDSAALLSRSALYQARAIGFAKGEADALVSLSTTEAINGVLDTALQHITAALSIYAAIGDEEGLKNALNNRAGVHYGRASYAESLADLQRVYQMAEAKGDYRQIAQLLHNMGLIYSVRGDRVSSLRSLLRAQEIKDSLRDTVAMSMTYHLLGGVYRDMGQLARAEENYRAAIEGYQRDGDRVNALYLYDDFGKLLIEKENADSALFIFQEGIDLAEELHLADQKALLQLAIANLYRKQGLFEAADDLYRSSIDTFRAKNHIPGLAEALIGKGKMDLQKGRLELALGHGQEAYDIITEVGNPRIIRDANLLLYEAARQNNQYDLAIRHLEEANIWRDSLEGLQKSQQLQQIQMDFELKLAENESQLALLSKENELQQMSAFAQKRWLIGLTVGLFLISLSLLMVLRLYRQKQDVNQQLANNVQELDQNRKQLEEANFNLRSTVQQLELTNHKLQQFAFAASHDLKESVRSITSFSQLLARQIAASQRRQHEYLNYIVNGGRRMQKTLNNLLNYNNLGFETKLDDYVDLGTVLNIVESTLRKNPNYNLLTLTTDDLPALQVERIQMEQLFYNVLENSLYYHRPGEPVLVHLGISEREKEIVFYLRDNGMGVEQKYLNDIFEPFFRLHDRERSGSGLGLAICKRIVEIYHGKIWAECPEAGGMIIYISFPNELVKNTTGQQETASI